MSYITNLVKWKKASNLYARIEIEAKLMIKEEYPLTRQFVNDFLRLREDPSDLVTIQHKQCYVVIE